VEIEIPRRTSPAGFVQADWKMKESPPLFKLLNGKEADGEILTGVDRTQGIRPDGPAPFF